MHMHLIILTLAMSFSCSVIARSRNASIPHLVMSTPVSETFAFFDAVLEVPTSLISTSDVDSGISSPPFAISLCRASALTSGGAFKQKPSPVLARCVRQRESRCMMSFAVFGQYLHRIFHRFEAVFSPTVVKCE